MGGSAGKKGMPTNRQQKTATGGQGIPLTLMIPHDIEMITPGTAFAASLSAGRTDTGFRKKTPGDDTSGGS